MGEHRWSGWPGAVCLNCGSEDQREICVAEHDDGLRCICGDVMCMQAVQNTMLHSLAACAKHVNGPCSVQAGIGGEP